MPKKKKKDPRRAAALATMPSPPPGAQLLARWTEDEGRFWAVPTGPALEPGALVVEEAEPLVAVVESALIESVCAHCFASPVAVGSAATTYCAVCRLVVYCSADCRRADAALHELECPTLARINNGSPVMLETLLDPVPRLLLRLACLRKVAPARAAAFDGLVASVMPPPTPAHLAVVRTLASLLCEGIRMSPEALYASWCRINSNCLSIFDDNQDAIGRGLYEVSSFFNHSCLPTCCFTNSGRVMRFATLDRVPPGDPLTICYGPVYAPTPERRAALEGTYGFVCRCKRCAAGPGRASREAEIAGVLCPEDATLLGPADDAWSRLVCTTCDHEISWKDAVSTIIEPAERERTRADEFAAKDGMRHRAIEINQQFLEKHAGKTLHPHSAPVFHARVDLLCLAAEERRPQLARDNGTRLLDELLQVAYPAVSEAHLDVLQKLEAALDGQEDQCSITEQRLDVERVIRGS